ncbi:MAG: N-succinyldiaminopimelate aminotransferase [Paraglaciecola psychrophila]|jgi:N-succinyldiaminopimelate aminotransferase
MNPNLSRLQSYPFEKLKALKSEVTAPLDRSPIALSIGEPKHRAPDFVAQILRDNMDKLSNYPTTKGLPALSEAIAAWLSRRFKLNAVDPSSQVIPVNGTREAIFSLTQAVVDPRGQPLVVCPNPFYQIYEGAAYLAGAEPHFLPCDEHNDYSPDYDAVSDEIWQRCQLLILCSPGNPTGAVTSSATLHKLIALADKFDFVIASDECYSELYFDEDQPPTGLLQACAEINRHNFDRCVVFHSLSKRSNLPGLRSGFIAGDAAILKPYLLYRTYHGCAMPVQHQLASAAAWSDEAHVLANRDQYRIKFDQVLAVLEGNLTAYKPDAGFYLWAKTPLPDTVFTQRLYAQENVTVLPGQYIGRESGGHNPGANRVRMALVADLAECVEAAQRIARFIKSL